jgi:hypothetical protein
MGFDYFYGFVGGDATQRGKRFIQKIAWMCQ